MRDVERQLLEDRHAVDIIVGYIDEGKTLREAALRYGVRPGILRRWMERDDDRHKRISEALAAQQTMNRDRVVEWLDEAANADPAKMFDDNGALRPIHDIPPEMRRLITHIEVENERDRETGEVIGSVAKVRLSNRLQAIELFGKAHGVFVDRTEISGPGGKPIGVEEKAKARGRLTDLLAGIAARRREAEGSR